MVYAREGRAIDNMQNALVKTEVSTTAVAGYFAMPCIGLLKALSALAAEEEEDDDEGEEDVTTERTAVR